MTEAEWLGCREPGPMLRHLADRATAETAADVDRRFRLFAAACGRLVWDDLDAASREAIEAAERFADGRGDRAELRRHCGAATADPGSAFVHRIVFAAARQPQEWNTKYNPFHGLTNDVWPAVVGLLCGRHAGQAPAAASDPGHPWHASFQSVVPAALATAADLLRCVAGIPHHPAVCDPAWRTSTAVGLARSIYAERTFDRLPILADALQDAGCDSDDVLAHCRGAGPHARGCWVVDLLLGKG